MKKMRFESKFSFGDKVWLIGTYPVKTWKPCGFCNAIGKITGWDGVETSCPKCYGRCGEYEYLPQKWQIGENMPMTVGQIRIQVTDSPGLDGETMFDNYKAQQKREEAYMCIESGVGSGSVYYVDRLFGSAEEARTECDKRNNTPEAPDDNKH